MRFLKMIINIVAGAVELILGVRILLKLFAASPAAAFTSWVYHISEPLIKPFVGIFPSPAFDERYILDIPAIFALFIYMALARIILSIGTGKNHNRY